VKFKDVFARARNEGFFLTMHCDVDQHNTTEHIRQVLQEIDVNRIDHGINVLDSDKLIEEVARRVGVTPLQVNEVLSYYSMLHRKPLGKYHVQVCTNISCLLHDGDKLYEHACRKLGIGHKEVTADGQISLEEVECMGACSWAPAIQVNYDFHHFVTPEKLDQLLDGLREK